MLEYINTKKLKRKIKLYKNKFKRQLSIITLGVALTTSYMECGEENIEIINFETIQKNNTLNNEEKDKIIEETRKKIYEEYNTFFENYEIDYKLEEYFITKPEIKDLLYLSNYDTECTYENIYDVPELIKKIENNTLEFVKENNDYETIFDYNHDFLQKALTIVIDKATNNINEDIHKMETLKIVFGNLDSSDNIILGNYDVEQNLIVLDYKSLELVAEVKNINIQDAIYSTLLHELNHVRQHKCACRINDLDNLRLSYNGVLVSTIIESSAESEIYNLDKQLKNIEDDTYYYSYDDERQTESLLFLLALFNENANIEDYYNAIFNSSWIELMDFFDLKTEEEKYTFFKILYIIDALNGRNDLPYTYYGQEKINENIILQQLQLDLGYSYKTEIFKIMINKLIDYTNLHDDFDLTDNLMLFNIIKNEIIENSYILIENNDTQERLYDNTFIKEVLELENKYMEFLELYYETSIEKIRALEKIDIYWYGTCLTNESTGDYITDKEGYEKRVKNLLEKFPILKPILYSNNYYIDRYNIFTVETNIEEKVYKINKK